MAILDGHKVKQWMVVDNGYDIRLLENGALPLLATVDFTGAKA